MTNVIQFLEAYEAPKLMYDMLTLCVGSPEHPIYHPEGTLEKHISIVLERAMERTENRELHFAAVFHDICKHGHLECIGREYQIGRLKVIDEGSYWQNIHHAAHAAEFIRLPLITNWLTFFGIDVQKVIDIVGNHMKMKTYLNGEAGKKNGMKASKRERMKDKLDNVWDDLYFFSNYCDSMLKPTNK